jgi:hypothetical protein
VWNQLRRVLARFWRSASETGSTDELRTTDARARFWAEVRAGEREAEGASSPEQTNGDKALRAPSRNEEKNSCCKSVAPTTITDVRS